MPSAIEQVLTAFRTPLETAGLSVEVDRDENELLQAAEYPVVAMSWLGATVERIDTGDSYFWRGQVAFDCWSQVATGQTTLAQCTAMISTIAQVIQTEQVTSQFGGLFHDCTPISVGDFASLTGDTGSITLTVAVQFQTPKGDWNTIIT